MKAESAVQRPDINIQPEPPSLCSFIWKGALVAIAVGLGIQFLSGKTPLDVISGAAQPSVPIPEGVMGHHCGTGLHLTGDLIVTLKDLIPSIMNSRLPHPQINWLSKDNTKVFSLTNQAEDLVFKTSTNYIIDEQEILDYRYSINNHKTCTTIAKAEAIIREQGFDLVEVLPATHLIFKMEKGLYSLLVQKKMAEIEGISESKQEEHYKVHSKAMRPTIQQLAHLILRTGWNDVTPRNAPIKGFKNGVPVVGLHDLDMISNDLTDGAWGRQGLLNCIYPENFDVIRDEAKKLGAKQDNLEERINGRKSQIKIEEALIEFYREKGVVDGSEPLQVNIDALGLDLDKLVIWREAEMTMRTYLEKTIEQMNSIMASRSLEQYSLKGRRDMQLGWGPDYSRALAEVMKALQQHGYIFSTEAMGFHGSQVQA